MKTRSRTFSINTATRTLLLLFCLVLSAGAAEMRSVEVERVDGRYIMRSEVHFSASVEAVYSVFANYDLSTKFSGAIVEARNIDAEEDGRPGFYVRNRGCVLFFCKSFERYGYVEREPYKVIRASVDPERSDFHLSNESWHFEPNGTGTVVRYDLEFEPKFWVPPVVGPIVIKRKLQDDGGEAMETHRVHRARVEAVSHFATRVLAWYDEFGRKDLPWQKPDAYAVWVSEVMLQQTQVTTVIPYYEQFMASFPNAVALADAHVDEVLSHWSGLGYYARARNLHKAAQIVRDEHGGVFPDDFDAVVELPGIGRSTAGAILALAFGQRHTILDGNVKRVLSRHRAVAGWPGKTAVARELWGIAEANTPTDRVAAYTQAIMDLGATLCTRSRPDCAACPVSSDCAALAAGTIENYPGRKAKTEKPLRQTTMVLAVSDNAIFLERRPAAGIWGGLWSLPEVQDEAVADWCRRVLACDGRDQETWSTVRHSFSHFDLDIEPVVVRGDARSSKVADASDATWCALDEDLPGGIAAPVQKLIDRLKTEQHGTNR